MKFWEKLMNRFSELFVFCILGLTIFHSLKIQTVTFIHFSMPVIWYNFKKNLKKNLEKTWSVDFLTQKWPIYQNFEHNKNLLQKAKCFLLPTHRWLPSGIIFRKKLMNNFAKNSKSIDFGPKNAPLNPLWT